MATTTAQAPASNPEDNRIAEKKRLALTYLSEAWEEAASAGVDSEILAHVAMFRAFSNLIETYGEEAVAGLVHTLPERIRAFEFSPHRIVQ
ncbi:hypothetical protein [Bauldia litoralis]|uniref:hypothetical protein n=1 Tax=Bauldia litoralis TaxID=665467 RepID=UPI00326467E6